MEKKHQSLHQKLIIRFGLVYFISFIAIFGLIVLQYTNNFNRSIATTEAQITQALINKGKVLAQNNSNALTGMIEDNAFSAVHDLISKTINSDSEIIFGFYHDNDANAWSKSVEDSFAVLYQKELATVHQWASRQMSVDHKSFKFDDLEVIVFAAPVFIYQERFGELSYGLSTKEIRDAKEAANQKARQSLIITISLFILSLVVFGSVAYFIISKVARRITIPLNLLTEAADVISSGDYDKRIDVRTDDEIGLLARSFNVMVRNINRQISDLAKINQLGSLLASVRDEQEAVHLILQGIAIQMHMESAIALVCQQKGLSKLATFQSKKQKYDFSAMATWIQENLQQIEGVKSDLQYKSLFKCRMAQFAGDKPFSYDTMYWLTLDVHAEHDYALALFGYESHILAEQSEQEFCLSVAQLLATSLRNISMNDLLEQQNRDLEQKVTERTQALEHKNLALSDALDELGKAQEQLVESEKMASLGSLVAGISHEVNTPLGISVTAASHLGVQAKQFEKIFNEGKLTKSGFTNFLKVASEGTDIILANLDRASELIKSFKQIAVDQSSDIETLFDVGEHLKMLITSLKPSYKHLPIEISLEIQQQVSIKSFPGLLNQVITNLIMNSIKHGLEECEAGKIRVELTEEQGKAIVTVEDNGIGIKPEYKNKIFDPFFTTKRGTGGSGLGLNIVYNLIKQKMGGEVKLEDVEPTGARFIIELPLQRG